VSCRQFRVGVWDGTGSSVSPVGQSDLVCTADEPNLPTTAMSGKVSALKGDSVAFDIR